MNPLAIYIHVPFCVRKCAYCDFASYSGCESQFDAYFEALGDEIAAWNEKLKSAVVTSVFFGGGTPSYPPAEKICAVMAQLKEVCSFAPDAEITIEANPGTLTPEKLRMYRASGINRISIGVQSFDAQLLQALGRIHSPEEAREAVEMAHAAGFENISVDLMYALPGQDMQAWAQTIDTALTLPLTHISAYSLIVEPGTKMAEWVETGRVSVPDDDTVNDMQRMAIDRFEKAGLARYEISNFARPGFESRHNMTYWTGGDYLGLGSAAHSLVDERRFSNAAMIGQYLSGGRMLEVSERSPSDRMEEMLMLATRTVRGLDLDLWAQQFGSRLEDMHAKQIRRLENYGYIEIASGFLRLSRAGMELQDAVVLELMD